MIELKKRECKGGCGYKITIVPKFEGMYCNQYCCGCCPDAKKSPCQKERKFGGPIENLAKIQLRGEK